MYSVAYHADKQTLQSRRLTAKTVGAISVCIGSDVAGLTLTALSDDTATVCAVTALLLRTGDVQWPY